MSRLVVCLAVLALFAAIGESASSVTLTSIQPPKMSVNVSYVINGQKVMLSSPCTQQAPGAACLPKPHARRDQVVVSYAVLPQFQANTTDTVQVKACYSNFSQVNRPWRAANNLISKSKACPFVIANGLNPASGNATWKIPQNIPTATYWIRTYVLQKNASDPSTPYPVAFGTSQGFFEVIPINDKEKGLKVAAGICICVGPILFTLLMLWEYKFSKKRV